MDQIIYDRAPRTIIESGNLRLEEVLCRSNDGVTASTDSLPRSESSGSGSNSSGHITPALSGLNVFEVIVRTTETPNYNPNAMSAIYDTYQAVTTNTTDKDMLIGTVILYGLLLLVADLSSIAPGYVFIVTFFKATLNLILAVLTLIYLSIPEVRRSKGIGMKMTAAFTLGVICVNFGEILAAFIHNVASRDN